MFSFPTRKVLIGIIAPLFFGVLGFVTIGYHPGAEDDGVYLAAVKSDVNPSLYPYDQVFFKAQLDATVFDKWLAFFVKVTGLSVQSSAFLWQCLAVFLIIFSASRILRILFDDVPAQLGGMALLATMFALPVTGTALYIVDQYLHPRTLATVLVLFAVSRILSARVWQAVPLVIAAIALHPLMGAFGASFCCILSVQVALPKRATANVILDNAEVETAFPAFLLLPGGWVFTQQSQEWVALLKTRHWSQLYQWTWYEWLGVIAPMVLYIIIARVATKNGQTKLGQLATALAIYTVFQQLLAMVILSPIAPSTLATLEPMRYLHLDYVFLMLIGGAYIGRYLLKTNVVRWASFLVLTSGGMFLSQRQLFAGTEHIEFPRSQPANAWVQAFDWIKDNVPQDAHFALDPGYMALPGEDYHSFRALAERSALADAIKDPSVVTKVPQLYGEWEREIQAQQGWQNFTVNDFKRLNSEFGVNWVLVANTRSSGLRCPWHNDTVSVCAIDK
jgi:hypothetical protein